MQGVAAGRGAGLPIGRRGGAAARRPTVPEGGVPVMTRRAWLAAVALAAATGVALAADPKLRFELYKDKQDEYRWRLKADDKNLATSGQGYKAKADCTHAIDRIKSDADT